MEDITGAARQNEINLEADQEALLDTARKLLDLIRSGIGRLDEDKQKIQAQLDRMRPAYLSAMSAQTMAGDHGPQDKARYQRVINLYEELKAEYDHLGAEIADEEKDLIEEGDDIDESGLDLRPQTKH